MSAMRRRVAVAEPAGLLLLRQVAFDRLERAHGPVAEPAVARGLVLASFPFPGSCAFAARPADGRPPRRSAQARARARGRAGPSGSSGGCGRISSRYSRIASDWNSGGPPSSEHERRHHALRVDREVVGARLLALQEIDRDLLGLQALQGERHAHAVARERAPETVQLHGLTLMFASLISLAYLSISVLMNAANSRRRARHRLDAEVGEALLDVGIGERLDRVGVQLVDHGLGAAGGQQHAPPVDRHQAGRRFAAQRRLGQQLVAARRR